MIYLRHKARRHFSVRLRDHYGLNSFERVRIKDCAENIVSLCKLYQLLNEFEQLRAANAEVIKVIMSEYECLLRIIVVDVPDRPFGWQKVVGMTFASMEAHLNLHNLSVSERFRFQSFDHMRRLLIGFQFPTGKIILKKGYSIYAEELLLISLSRLSFPGRWSDLYERFPGRRRWFLQAAFYWFLDFMIQKWAYLLLNNMHFWKDYLAASCEAIRVSNYNNNT